MKDLEQKHAEVAGHRHVFHISAHKHLSLALSSQTGRGKWLQASQQAERKPNHSTVATLDGG